MPHEIDRVLDAAATHIWMIEPTKAREIAAFLVLRAEGTPTGWEAEAPEQVYAVDPIEGRTGPIHVIRLHGTIMPRGGMMSRYSGGAALDKFSEAFQAAASDSTAQAIVLDIDSPGGIVDMVPEAAEMVRAARRADRPIVAHANSMIASAAYWIASGADEIVSTPSGLVGSIGVYTMHDDLTEAFKMRGIERTVIRAGKRKAEGVFGPLDEKAMKHRQLETDALYADFTEAVASGRGVPGDVVRADPEDGKEHMGGGRAYRAKAALRLGLIDRVETFDQTISRLSSGRRNRRANVARARLNLS